MKLASRHPPTWRLEIWVGPDRWSVVRGENTNLSLVGFSEKLVVLPNLPVSWPRTLVCCVTERWRRLLAEESNFIQPTPLVRCSSVGIATRLQTGLDRNLDPGTGKRFSYLHTRTRPNGIWGPMLFSWGKTVGAWSWHLTSCSAEVKTEWSYTSAPPICAFVTCKAQLNFYEFCCW